MQVSTGRVVVVDANEALERGKNAFEAWGGKLLVVLRRNHTHDIIQYEDAFWCVQRIQLGLEPRNQRIGDDIQHLLYPVRGHHHIHHERGDACQP